MGSVNISIKDDAYEFLKSLKTKEKSFSDVILSFKKKKTPLDFFGCLKDKDWTTTEQRLKKVRASFNERLR